MGITLGRLPCGPLNAITDVDGVKVGHCTLIQGEGKLVPGRGPIRTGVTAILPHGGNPYREKVAAGVDIINGYGKCLGLPQIMELGQLESPILLTGTLNVWRVADALLDWILERNPDIAAALGAKRIRELVQYAAGMGMECLVEVHSAGEVEKALEGGAEIIGINNRDLGTLEVDLGTAGKVLPYIPAGTVVVSESGVTGREQVDRLEEMGVDAVLVGEVLMRAEDPEAKIRELLGEVDKPCGSRSVG